MNMLLTKIETLKEKAGADLGRFRSGDWMQVVPLGLVPFQHD